MRHLAAVFLCVPAVLGKRRVEDENYPTNPNVYVGEGKRNVKIVTGEEARTLLAEANSEYPLSMFTAVPDVTGAEKYMIKALPSLLANYFAPADATTFGWLLSKVATEHGVVKLAIKWKNTEKTFSEEETSTHDVAFSVSEFPLLLHVDWKDFPLSDVKDAISPPERLYMLLLDRDGSSFLAGYKATRRDAKIKIQKWLATLFDCNDIPMRFEIRTIDSSVRQQGVAYAVEFVDVMGIITQDLLNTQLMQKNLPPEKLDIVETVKVTRNLWLRTPWMSAPQHCPYGSNMGHFNLLVGYSENQTMFLHYHCQLQTWYGREGQRWCETEGKGTVVLTGKGLDSAVALERLPIPTAPGKKMKDWTCTFFKVPDQWGDEKSQNVVRLGSVGHQSDQNFQPSGLHDAFHAWGAYSPIPIDGK